MRRGGQSFLKGAAILMGAVAVVKLLGALFKIPLSWILTPVGTSYFGSAYSLYFPIYSLSAAGFPVAISRLVSECCARGRFRDVRAIYQVSVKLFFCIGVGGLALMLLLAPPFATLASANQPKSLLPAIWALAPSIFFCSMVSVYRGLYEGLRDMVPTAISQIVEALCRLLFGLGLSWGAVQAAATEYAAKGTVWGVPQLSEEYAKLAALPLAAAGAIFGVTIGSVLSFLYLWLRHRIRGDGILQRQIDCSPPASESRVLLGRLWRTALPVALGSLAVNLSTLADAACLNARLGVLMNNDPTALLNLYAAELPAEVVRLGGVPSYLYGCFTNASTLFLLVPTITQAFGISALPSVTAAWASGSKERLARSARTVVQVTALLAIPAGLGMAVLSKPICAFLYGNRNAPSITGQILFFLGLAAIFSALSTPLNSLMQAVGRPDLPVKILGAGLLLKLVLNWVLVPLPEWNVLGAAFSTLVSYLFITVVSIPILSHVAGIRLRVAPLFLKPLLAGISCAFAARFLYDWLSPQVPEAAALGAAVAAAMVVYLAGCMILRAFPPKMRAMRRSRQKIS